MRYAILLVMLATLAAHAADYPRDIALSWTNASEYVDGTSIEAGELTEVMVECYRNQETTPTFQVSVPANGVGQPQTYVFQDQIPQPGTYTCYGYSIVYDGQMSDQSNPASRKYVGKPLPPQTFE